jgi:hypothetical protein
MRMVTIIDGGRALRVEEARIAGERLVLAPAALREALGWELHDDQLCNDALCVPVPPGAALEAGDGIDLAAVAAVLDRPLALDLEERAAYLGASARERAQALRSLQAPDFTLPDLAGRRHALSDQRGRKILLVAWGSW